MTVLGRPRGFLLAGGGRHGAEAAGSPSPRARGCHLPLNQSVVYPVQRLTCFCEGSAQLKNVFSLTLLPSSLTGLPERSELRCLCRFLVELSNGYFVAAVAG